MYMILPTFVKDENRSAWEGETMHKVGDLEPRGDYEEFYALRLMSELIDNYLRRVKTNNGTIEIHKDRLRLVLDK